MAIYKLYNTDMVEVREHLENAFGLIDEAEMTKKGVAYIVYKLMRRDLPYSIQEVDDNHMIITNRDYKPLGMTSDKYVDYSLYPSQHIRVLTTKELIKFSHRNVSPGYLFYDGCKPWDSKKYLTQYRKRLSMLYQILYCETAYFSYM